MIQRRLLSYPDKSSGTIEVVGNSPNGWEFDTIEGCTRTGVPISASRLYDGMQIDWGDGSITIVTSDMLASNAYQHSYSTAGQYHIVVSYDSWETVDLIDTYVPADEPTMRARSSIRKVSAIPKVSNKYFSEMFWMWQYLQEIPSDLFAYNPQITSFSSTYGAFQSCTSLTSIPSDLFRYNTVVTNFGKIFQGCSALANQTVYITSEIVSNADYFMYGAGSGNIVYVPAGSVTESTFNSASNLNCTVATYTP